MNYQKLYVNLLIKHGTEDKPKEGYYEHHHIVPKFDGGTDALDNMIYLSGRCHFIAHWILHKLYDNRYSARAFYGMCDNNTRPKRQRISSIKYEIAKKAFSKNNHMKEDEHRERASVSAKQQWIDNYEQMKQSNAYMFKETTHPMYMKGKTGFEHPRSRKVQTPLGIFGSVRDAGKAHGIVHNMISRRCKSTADKYSEYFYLD